MEGGAVMSKDPGPAARLIDFGFAVKLPLCEAVDDTFGFEKSSVGSFTGFLKICYELRRPYFMLADGISQAINGRL